MASDLAAFRGMERHLRGEPDQADYLVDLSNIVRETGLGGGTRRSLERLRLVLAALCRTTGDPDVTVHAIADNSLLDRRHDDEFPDPGEAGLLREWRDRGLIAAIGKADPDLLDHAKVFGTPVVSSDNFTGHRGDHPWIQGDREHFLTPERPAGGPVRLVRRDMRVVADREISREGERDDLKARNLMVGGRPRADILERSWRCPRQGCNPGPAIRGGKVVCRSHGTLLADAGPRRPRLQLKILVDGRCQAWENLAEDESREFALGRGHLARIDPELLAERRRLAVSRHHLVIVAHRGTLRVLDTSKGRSRIRTLRPGGAASPWRPLPHRDDLPPGAAGAARYAAFGPDEEIELVPGVVLRRSGQRWPGERTEGVRARPPRRPRHDDELTLTD
ncbi:FHA domain-containing protein [Kitasatospora sp. DSM 101779]|uniref:FHA domain-containing protein n=1 Tax=Kitasatospora sp. DSM 101779 TaxID=2853165 RepID=UPI0021D89E75|nr:FHA domain-containing protein [Kitasatospora sp. DSM 101779]MCU7820748.1 FHA domain-containing protein [Kitasatospora sp. DSM 101779]